MGRDGPLKTGEQNEGVINEECSDVQCCLFEIQQMPDLRLIQIILMEARCGGRGFEIFFACLFI